MTVETDLYSAVTGDATLNGLIGTRMYPARSPASATYPLITYNVVSRVVLGGKCYRARIQMLAAATSYATMKGIRNALQTLAEGTLNWVYVEGPDGYEDAEGIYTGVVDLIIS